MLPPEEVVQNRLLEAVQKEVTPTTAPLSSQQEVTPTAPPLGEAVQKGVPRGEVVEQ